MARVYSDILKLPEMQGVQPSKPRSARRQQHRNNVPADTPEEHWRRSLFYPLVDHIANKIEERIVVPEERFLAQYLIPSRLASLTQKREHNVFAPFLIDLRDENFALLRTEMIRWSGKMLTISQIHRPIP